MSGEKTIHLTDEAIDDVLIGLGSRESEVHLAVCVACREKVEVFQENVSAFKQASLAWAESKSVQGLIVTHKARSGWGILSPAEWALAAAVFLFLGLPIWNHAPSLNASQVAVSDAADTEQQIAQDNDLLRSIDAALTANEVPAATEYLKADKSPTHPREKSKLRDR